MNDIIIHQVTEIDWNTLKTIRLESLKESPLAFLATYEYVKTHDELQWRELASAKSFVQFFLAIKDNQTIGIIGGMQNAILQFHLVAMWVNPQFRGCGISDCLIEAIKNFATFKKYQSVFLNVSSKNSRAFHFYIRHGFTLITEQNITLLNSDESSQKMQCFL